MNKKLALYATFFSLLAPFLTGCICTKWVGGHIGTPCFDKFKPSAVYRSETHERFALEGTRETRGGSFRAFLTVNDNLLARANAQTNQTLSLEDIQKAYERLALERDETRRKIPPDYIRVAVLPKNDLTLDVGIYYPGGDWAWLIPFAYIAREGSQNSNSREPPKLKLQSL